MRDTVALPNRRWSKPMPRLSFPAFSEIMDLDLNCLSELTGTGRSPLRSPAQR